MNERPGLGRWVAGPMGKWATLLVWILAAALLSMLLPSVNKEEANNAPDLSDAKPSVQADAVAEREFPSGSDIPALLVWHRAGGLQDADLANVQKLARQLTEAPAPNMTSVPPLHQMPLQALKAQLSEDGSTLVTPVFFGKQADADQLKEGVEKLKEEANAVFGGKPFDAAVDSTSELSARVTGPVGIQIDATGLFKNADFALLMATVLLVLVLLLLIYRSPILAFIPLIAVGFAYGVIGPILGWMAREGWIAVDAQGISIMTVLLFGAGTDYCLFLISRFRQLLKTDADKGKALRRALSGSAGAIAMSGFTVVLSLLALLVAQYGSYHRFAIPFSIAIFIMGLASLTLVPALLAIIGRASFWPFVPRTAEMQAARARRQGKPAPAPEAAPRYRTGSLVVRRPWLIVAVSVIALGGLAAFASQIKFTYDIMSSFPKDMASREGYAVIGEQFSPGELAPAKVMADTQGRAVQLKEALSSLPYVSRVSEPETGRSNPQIVGLDVELNLNPYAMEAMDRIPELRDSVEQTLQAAGVSQPSERVWIGGQTAEQYDTKATGERDTRMIIPIVIGLITLLLLAYLRSVTATIYLVLTVILSYFSALGLGWLVVHHLFGADAISGSIPLYAFVFLVALGEDYNIFMISNIWRKSERMPLKQAIREGVGETGAVITSAGLILAGTFAVLATLPIQVLVQFGVITAIGVLLDTFVVRPFLVPAITLLLGRWAFWPSRRGASAAQTETESA
ncbi:MMPL family transporter [Cohnella nanjingensis]|uniref:MMPL family transporter n=1 Tax=Cohnella nanjingensis TaxID=1387779 RepID=A0A7X0VHX9_9BACL|nr:MMPL family transporter [Cohnella nanjingensis]MBB6673943.1 MMPL family transporter [Cohnella nanjingensis]